eukprot:scaffold3846_cov45-Isochrysis_galbana.AAC.1
MSASNPAPKAYEYLKGGTAGIAAMSARGGEARRAASVPQPSAEERREAESASTCFVFGVCGEERRGGCHREQGGFGAAAIEHNLLLRVLF